MSVALHLRELKNDRRGVALVEFACVLPVLLLMYLGGYQLTDALSCSRKVTISARAVTDLITQNASISGTQMQTILGVPSRILAPYNSANSFVRISELYTDKNGNTTVYWSKDSNGSGLVQGSSVILPSSIKVNDSYIVLGQVAYSYKPMISLGIFKPLSLSDSIYMNARVSQKVDYNP